MTVTVAIVQRRMTHYRVPLFELMRERLAGDGVALRVLHGEPTAAEASKNDSGHLAWAEHLPTRYFADGRVCWQPFMHRVHDCRLVVVTQENKLVNNLPPLLDPWRRQALAFWGHGRNLQASRPDSPAERFKRWTTRRVDWWFAYTELSAQLVEGAGYPPGRVTVLNNSIDTSTLGDQVRQARTVARADLRRRFGLGAGPVGLFVGSLYADKRIDWLLEAALHLRRRVPGFQLAVAGAGPQRSLVEQAAAAGEGVVYVGSVGGQRKADLLACADLVLNPGLVGLGILDAFAAGLPLVTTDCGLHSPEIAYLENGVNGLMTRNDPEVYVQACQGLLADPAAAVRLGEGALRSAASYSLQRMAARFCGGVMACLAARG